MWTAALARSAKVATSDVREGSILRKSTKKLTERALICVLLLRKKSQGIGRGSASVILHLSYDLEPRRASGSFKVFSRSEEASWCFGFCTALWYDFF
jgi:hypothetical protein